MNSVTTEVTTNVYTVSQLNHAVKSLLERQFAYVFVEGELSNFMAPHSGHWYFSIKDSDAQVRCAMFRAHQRHFDCTPKDGMEVLIKARISLYTARGDYQLIVESLEERGEGKLRRAYEALFKKLKAAALFEVTHKQRFPLIPTQIAIVTSPTGAVICDILTVLQRRFPAVPVIIYPTRVQGKTAGSEIITALQRAIQHKACDVIILARGGGSLEDLWCFNDEMLAHAIYNCSVPIMTGIGHEVDFTIADFVADIRAPTPSAAAEIITPDARELLQQLNEHKQSFEQQLARKMNTLQQQLTWLQKQLEQQHPKQQFQQKIQQLDIDELRLCALQREYFTRYTKQLAQQAMMLQANSPLQCIQHLQNMLSHGQETLKQYMNKCFEKYSALLKQQHLTLEALSPLATLARGYAIATQRDQNEVLRQINEVHLRDTIKVRLVDGELTCIVREKKKL